jgi:hypothetical protein
MFAEFNVNVKLLIVAVLFQLCDIGTMEKSALFVRLGRVLSVHIAFWVAEA